VRSCKHFSFKNILCSSGEIAKTYDDYLLTQHWRLLRLQIYELREHKCEKCKQIISVFHVHHITYARIGHERKSDLKLLCYKCHEKLHMDKDIRKQKIKVKKQKAILKVLKDTKTIKYHPGKYYNYKEASKTNPVTTIHL